MSRQFIKGDDDLASRVNRLDYKPDTDVRYRVNELFCHADTWLNTLNLAMASFITAIFTAN